MTQKTKQLKQFLTFTILAGFLFGCNADEESLSNLQNKNNHIMYKTVSLQSLEENKTVYSKLTKPKKNVKNPVDLTSGRIIKDTINNFYIDSNKGIFIQNGNYHSYTFKINRPNGSLYSLENIVVSKKSETEYETFLYQYNLTAAELNKLNNLQEVNLLGKVTKIKLENSNIKTDLLGKYLFNGHCYEDVTTFVPGHLCQQGLHDIFAGEQCIYFGGAGSATLGMNVMSTVEVSCDEGGGSSDPINNGTSNQNGTPQNPGTPNGVIQTTPVLGEIESPCDKIKPKLNPSKGNLKDKIINMRPGADLTNGEHTMQLNKTISGSYSTGSINISVGLQGTVKSGGDAYGSIHTHPWSTSFPMFSFTDVYSLSRFFDNSASHNTKDVSVILVIKIQNAQGILEDVTYALTINNSEATFMAKVDAIYNSFAGDEEKMMKDMDTGIKEYFDKEKIANTKNYERSFLNFFKDYGITLHKANSDLTHWEQLSINDLNKPIAQQTVQYQPCN